MERVVHSPQYGLTIWLTGAVGIIGFAVASWELLLSLFAVAVLWLGFSVDYATTRDIYFTVAIAHVLAEAPFLLRMI